LPLEVVMLDNEGNAVADASFYYWVLELKGVQQNIIFTGGIEVDTSGVITARSPGIYDLSINGVAKGGEAFANSFFKVSVVNQAVNKIEIAEVERLYEGSSVGLDIKVTDKGGFEIRQPEISFTSSAPDVLNVDRFASLHALKEGKATITISVGGVNTTLDLEVESNPVTSLEIKGMKDVARTGDVVRFEARALDESGNVVSDMPINYAVSGKTMEYATGSPAMIDQDGRFVAEKPGIYRITASAGNQSANTSIEIIERNLQQKVVMKSQGSVNNKHTSDFWVWEGIDGKDYAVTGTWGADGKAYFWEVTNPAAISLIDSVQVDARTVNDVKVSEDGKICVISREGASNRKNGIVILDVTNPREVQVLSTFTENLTGGVHNLFIDKGYVYALSNGQWYEVVDISDPVNPKRVSKFVLPNSVEAIHDVWIEDGIAYSSNWSDGIAMVDIGNGIAGGSPENPVEISRAHVQGDANHAAFPYKSKDTGKFYVIAGDEIFPIDALSSPDATEVFEPSGYLHFMDMTDPENPKEVARYEVPEAGSHNFWVEDDKLYIGYYNGGLRVVDLSGDLMGDLYKQGREIAVYKPYDENGYVANAPFIWGAQPFKGHVFISDFNSGLYAVQLAPVLPEEATVEAK